MKRSLSFIFLILLALGCETESKLTFEKLQLENEKCDDCPNIKIEVPQALDETRIARTINNSISEELIYTLKFEDTADVNTVQGAMKSFTQSYQEFQQKFDDEAIGWEAEINGEVIFESAALASLVLNTYTFTGGAHGYGSATFLNFDKLKGIELENHEMFSDLEGFIALAEDRFRNEHDVPKKANINATGFMFSGDTFHLAENLGFTDEGIQLIYNQYEVASYADGPIELIIPFEQANQFLKEKYSVKIN
ncbi:DUF3298 and DUF4163 domain-containing protein [Croceitalea rosinachiae]|uniref:DUF4163 domain-containing protein n=1 Tax=Croceitalea rosinachiae TaxID=3075596 RepID=A0ABU3A8K7_9FLAO|nr:DUF4163 domain-containing protein [Croceitalea sp. F388]MDT0606522.1 DUF4163 domain-containing protein [Croceitalea sp. F388]